MYTKLALPIAIMTALIAAATTTLRQTSSSRRPTRAPSDRKRPMIKRGKIAAVITRKSRVATATKTRAVVTGMVNPHKFRRHRRHTN